MKQILILFFISVALIGCRIQNINEINSVILQELSSDLKQNLEDINSNIASL